MANFTKLPPDAIANAVAAGKDSNHLAEIFNCTPAYVREKARKLGLHLIDVKPPSVAKFTLAQAQDALARKLHPNAVALETGLTPHYIRMRVRHLGILLPGMAGQAYAPPPPLGPTPLAPESPITPALIRLAEFDPIAQAALARKKGRGR